jgi:hypothetical protein
MIGSYCGIGYRVGVGCNCCCRDQIMGVARKTSTMVSYSGMGYRVGVGVTAAVGTR